MEMETNIGLAELFAAMIRAWKGILITLLLFAALLGGYQTYQQISLAQDPKNSPEEIEERYQKALEDYETKKENLQKTLKNQEKSLASKEEYQEKSILLQIDPYDKYIANIVFTFSNIDESAQLFRYPNTAADYLPKKIRSQYMELWKSMDVPKDIGLTKYADVEWKYLSEVVSVSSLEGELVSIQASGSTSSNAEELASAIYNYFETHRDVIAASSAQHSFALINQVTKNVIDENLNTKKETLETEIENLKENIENSKKSIEDLKEPTREEGYSIAVIIKTVAKYVFLGAIVGAFLACLVICCWQVFANRAFNSSQLEQISGAHLLGSLQMSGSLAERLSNTVMGERYWKDTEQAAAYITEQAKANFPKGEKVLLLSTLSAKQAHAGMDRLTEVLSKNGYMVCAVMDALHDPKAVESMQSCSAVIFVEKVGHSDIKAFRNCAAQVEDAKGHVLGIVTI